MTLSTEQGFTLFLVQGTILQGCALAEQGRKEEGITQMRDWLTIWHARGAELFRPLYFAPLAAAYGQVGQPEAGLAQLAEALAAVQRTGERWYEAELHRIKGELTLEKSLTAGFKLQNDDQLQSDLQSLTAEAEECFLKALTLAQRQQAKSLELRAVMSLSRLWQRQDKKEEA